MEDPLTDQEIRQISKQIGEDLYIWYEKMAEIFKKLSYNQLSQLCSYFKKDIHSRSKGFRTTIWDEVVDRIEMEVIFRKIFDSADQHFQKTGNDFFCVVCGGTCQGLESQPHNQ